ncbi:hypothetical protein HMPREF3213_01659 [Heyndrickxia coagulans]|uniref:Uncharacterized protein n=1 Tax=Heyndrickxia coagulans TaxID=1398 RepID=A0A133KT85_HEYCO|nr:hypothetical protein HMPREF3213_01659 [Heyndrickxia coagulans]
MSIPIIYRQYRADGAACFSILAFCNENIKKNLSFPHHDEVRKKNR